VIYIRDLTTPDGIIYEDSTGLACSSNRETRNTNVWGILMQKPTEECPLRRQSVYLRKMVVRIFGAVKYRSEYITPISYLL
jgi:hypothetical protein